MTTLCLLFALPPHSSFPPIQKWTAKGMKKGKEEKLFFRQEEIGSIFVFSDSFLP